MFAYVFWHAKPESVDADSYETALLHFAVALHGVRIPRMLGNASYAIESTPWLQESGYEDWTWVEDLSVFEALNTAAVSGPMENPHAGISQITKHGGFGALYYLVAGAHQALGDSKVFWVSRPRGIRWVDVMPAIVQSANADVAVWRRFMVLGPAAEFAIVGPAQLELTLPPGWTALEIRRRRLCAP